MAQQTDADLTPTVDPDPGPDDTLHATIADVRSYPHDDDMTPRRGVVYEGRINNVTATGTAYVSLGAPWNASQNTGVLPTSRQPRTDYLPGDTVYVAPAELNRAGPVFHTVAVTADAEPEPETEMETDADETTVLPNEFEAFIAGDDGPDPDADPDPDETETETETENETENASPPIVEYGCPICPTDDRFTDEKPQVVRLHITSTSDAAHKDRKGTEPSVQPLALAADGSQVEQDEAAQAPGGETGEMTTTLIPPDRAETEFDEVILETAVNNPSLGVQALVDKLADETDHTVSTYHVGELLDDVPVTAGSATTHRPWVDRNVLAKLYYYYGLSQGDIGDRYDINTSSMSRLMTSLDINPTKHRTTDKTLNAIADEFGYDWADDIDTRGDGTGDPDDDPTIPRPDHRTETESTTPTTETTDTDTETDDAVTITRGGRSYTGPATGLDATVQYFGERPVKQPEPEPEPEPEIEPEPEPEPDPEPEPESTGGAGADAGTVDGVVVSAVDVERVAALIGRLEADAGAGDGSLGVYARGMACALDALGLDAERDDVAD